MSAPARTAAPSRREAFTLAVAMDAERPRTYRFDRDRVLVGRGHESQLAVRQRHVSRHQFEVRRLAAGGGGCQFFLLPYGAVTNPVVPEAGMSARTIRLRGESEQPIACFQLEHGARFSVGPVHFTFARGARASRTTLLLGGCIAAVALLLAFDPAMGIGSSDTALDALAADIFAPGAEAAAAPAACEEPRICATMARQFYQEGRRDMASVNVDRGMGYRAARAFERAASYRDGAGGAPLPELADLDAQLKVARDQTRDAVRRANARFQELRRRAMTAECVEAGEALEALLPDKDHPYRRKLSELRNSQTGFRGACGG